MRYWLKITGIVEFDPDDRRDSHIRRHLEAASCSRAEKFGVAFQEFQNATSVDIELTECEEQ